MLAYSVAAIGVLIIAAGILIMAAPSVVRDFMPMIKHPRNFYMAVGGRVLVGAFMVAASDACSWPMAVGTMGVVTLVAGFLGVFLGPERGGMLIDWVLRFPAAQWRALAPIALVIGGFIIYAAV